MFSIIVLIMKQTLQNRYTLEVFGSKTSIGMMRVLCTQLHKWMSITNIAVSLGTSRSTIHRVLPGLVHIGIVRTMDRANLSLVRMDTSSPLAHPIFEMFNHERSMIVDPSVRNVLSLLLADLKKYHVHGLILFGSQARGISRRESDIDLCLISDEKKSLKQLRKRAKDLLPEFRMEIHHYPLSEFLRVKDLVVLDTVLFGTALIGSDLLMTARSRLDSIDRSYLIWRLRSIKENIERADKMDGPAKEYFLKVATITFAEVRSILQKGMTISKTEIGSIDNLVDKVHQVEFELSRSGEKIWLD